MSGERPDSVADSTPGSDPIFDPRQPAIIVASAGSGKTWRLVRRYLKIVGTLDPHTGRAWAEPEEVVAVTFTRAAAAEMRERVFAALASADPVDADDHVVAELRRTHDSEARAELCGRLAGAPIGTLHSLCARLLRRFPELCGVPPDARPIDPGEHRVRLERFVRHEIDAALDDPDHPHHERCRLLLADRPLEALRDDLRALVEDERELPDAWTDPEALAGARRRFVAAQVAAIARALADPAAEVVRAVPRSLAAWSASRAKDADKVRASLHHASAVCSQIVEIAGAEPFEPSPSVLREAIDALWSVKSLSHAKRLKDASAPISELKRVNQIEARIRCRFVLKPLVGLDLDDRSHERAMARWIELGLDLRRRYADELRRDGLLRYGDLERLALELLENPAARQWLAGTYRHILVDEFQDTSAHQIRIVHALRSACGDAIPCFVGDPKQSIYRFRGAEVEGFMREVEASRAAGHVRALPNSRRPSPSLTGFFNEFFPPLFTGSPQLGPPTLDAVDDGAAVPWEGAMTTSRAHDRLPGAPVELLLRTWAGEGLDEPERLARHLHALIGAGEASDDPTRPRLRWGDVAILVPRWRLAETVRATLEEHGIPAEVSGGRGLLPLPEVQDLVAAVRLWSRADDELAALSIARGPMFGISDLGLYALTRWPGVMRRAESDEDPAQPWDDATEGSAPRRYPRSLRAVLRRGALDPELALRAMKAAGVVDLEREAELLDRLRADARSLRRNGPRFAALCDDAGLRGTADLLTDAITELELEAVWLASPRGRRAIANAWKFVEVVRRLEPLGPDLRGVADWLDSGIEPAPEGLISGVADAVTITTFHGAKGREWPVVYVAGLGEDNRGFGETWSSAGVPTIGGGDASRSSVPPGTEATVPDRIRVPRLRRPHEGFVVDPDPLARACAISSAPLDAAEQKRLLYVACTRARDKLVLSGDLHKTAHITKDDRSQLITGYHYKNEAKQREWKALEFQPRPLYLCRTIADYVVSALRAPYSPHSVPLLPPEDSPIRRWVVAPDDESLSGRDDPLPAHGIVADAETPIEVDANPRVLARGRGASVRLLSPSVDRSPWSAVGADWTLPLPDPDPVMPAEAIMEALDPRQLGELFHRTMEGWGFRGTPPEVSECQALAALAAPDHAGPLGAWLCDRVDALARTELATELHAAATARRVFHEVPIDAIVDGHRVRGQIDLLWQDAAGLWCVLDYKVTKRVTTRDALHELANEYGGQLQMYRQALAHWRPGGRMPFFGRFGLWLAPSARAMWMQT